MGLKLPRPGRAHREAPPAGRQTRGNNARLDDTGRKATGLTHHARQNSARQRLGAALLATVLACLAGSAWGEDAVLAAFQAPPPLARPMLRWWWPGNDVTTAGLAGEMQAAVGVGFGGFEIQPFRAGLFSQTSGPAAAAIDSTYTPDFFRHVADAARLGARAGAPIDYTFGSGWPTGGSGITSETGMMELRAAATTLTGPSHFHGMAPQPPPHAPSPIDKVMPRPAGQALPASWQARLAARFKLVALLAVRGSPPVLQARPGPPGLFGPPPPDVAQSGVLQAGSTVNLTGRIAADGTLDWDVPPGQWQLIALTQDASGQQVALAAGAGPQLVMDHFDASAFAAQARAVGDAGLPAFGGLIGHGLRSIFVDSFELTPENYWSADFMTEFRRRRGYDLTPYLPLILLPDWMNPYQPQASRPLYSMGDDGPRVLEDYHRTVSELMQERFFTPLADWSHTHGFSLRFQAHGAPVDLVQTYGMADIPETEDLFNGPLPDFLAYARSGADVYGRKLVSAESFIIAGHALDTTPAMLKARADRLFIGGVNRVVGHGMAYPALPDAGLGWTPFAAIFGTQFNPRNPIFDELKPWVGYMTRLQAVFQATRPVVPLALYRDAVFAHSILNLADAHEGALSAALRAGGYTADTLTRDGLLKSHVEHGTVVTPGGARYGGILIQDQASLDRRAADQLAAFRRDSVKIVFVRQIPSRALGMAEPGDDAAVRADVEAIAGAHPTVVNAGSAAGDLSAAGILPNLRFTTAGRADFIEHSDGIRHFVFLANPAGAPAEIGLALPYRGAVQQWHPWTGLVTQTAAIADGNGMRVSVHLDAYGSALLVIDPRHVVQAIPAPQTRVTALATIGAAGWRLDADGFDSAGHAVHLALDHAAPGDWRAVPGLGAFSGHGVYTTQFTLARRPAGRVLIDLGDVQAVARVSVNGCTAAVVMAPYTIDATDAIHAGTNALTILVANPPGNGEAGDTLGGFAPAPPAQAAGLIGPVRLLAQTGARDADLQAAACSNSGINRLKQIHH